MIDFGEFIGYWVIDCDVILKDNVSELFGFFILIIWC